jgi:PAS domain-containing protein
VHIKKVLGSDNEQSCELELLRDDGTSFFVNIISIKEHREDEILLIRSVVFDITERKIADEKIIQISSLLKMLSIPRKI